MSEFIQKPNTGSMFKNEHSTSEKSPHERGDATVVCPHCNKPFYVKLAGWWRKNKAQTMEYLSLMIEPFKSKADAPQRRQEPARPANQTNPGPTSTPDGGFNSPGVKEDDVPF